MHAQQEKKKETSELKAIGILKEYLLSLHDALRIQACEDIKQVLFQMFKMVEKSDRKSHRYEKKTVFDIPGVIYEHTHKLQAIA